MIPFKSIRVGPFDINLIKLTGEDGDKYLGQFSEHQLTIALRDRFPTEQQEAETLLHEVFHAIESVMNIGDKEPREKRVSAVSVGMAMVIRDNPGFIKYLTEKLAAPREVEDWGSQSESGSVRKGGVKKTPPERG